MTIFPLCTYNVWYSIAEFDNMIDLFGTEDCGTLFPLMLQGTDDIKVQWYDGSIILSNLIWKVAILPQ